MGFDGQQPDSSPAYGSLHEKKYGGWFNQLTPITTDGTYTLEPLSTNPYAAYKISSPNSNSEFFVVEYRKQAGLFESSLPSSGLLIYRINESIGGNANGPPDEVYIYRPGGTTSSNGNVWNATFSSGSGRTSFGVSTDPSCFLSDGSPGGIQITNVSSTGTTISFNLSFNNASAFNPPRNLTAQVNLNNVSLQWDTPENGTPTLSGYHLYRDGTLIHTISNPATLTYNDNNLSPGSYTYHATAYYISPTGESDPSNQATVFIQTLLPDLVITSSSIQPNIVLAGETVSWSMICKNTGTAVTGSFDNRVYLSKDQNRDAGDLLLGSVNYSNLAVNATQTWNGQALVPTGSDEGSWYILMCTDGNSEVVESDEGNNNQTHPITIKESYPDLNVFDISIPKQNIQDGKPVEFHFNISNIGTLSAGYFEVFVYLSDDVLPDASDYVLASVGVNGLNPSGHLSFEYNPVIPKGTTAGDYYLIIVADTGEVTGDKNTDNNKAFRMFTVFQLPDLTVSATLDQDEYRPGSTVHLQWNTENLDSGPADHYMLLVLLSPTLDNTFDDVALYFENGPLIYGGGSVTLDLPVTLDQDQPPGTYYLMIVADPDNTLPESSESNNSVTKSFNVMDISSSGHFNPENTILLYPNPVRRILHIQTGDLFKQGSYTVQIFNREGLKHYKKVLHKAPESILSVPVDFLIPGSYYLVIQQGTVTRTMPFIKLK
ncbi:MAG: hypothetical protein J7L89_03830 [Bacteroidales bacterium]|nr:hypothetical protein [Bacteroidales bacterium]